MLLFLFLLALAQEQGHDHEHGSGDDSAARFIAVQPGNTIEYGNFVITVPDGTLMADEDNVPIMFPLTGADYIPACIAVFFSSSNTWDWSVAAQYIEQKDTNFILSPRPTAERFEELFSERHLFTLKEPGVAPRLVAGPVFNDEEQSFLLAMSYLSETGDEYIFLKKIWIDGPRMLVYSMRATKVAFDTEFDTIKRVLENVKIKESDEPVNEEAETVTFLQVFGLNADLQTPMDTIEALFEAADNTKKGDQLAIILAIVGFGCLVTAFFMRKNKLAAQKAAGESEQA